MTIGAADCRGLSTGCLPSGRSLSMPSGACQAISPGCRLNRDEARPGRLTQGSAPSRVRRSRPDATAKPPVRGPSYCPTRSTSTKPRPADPTPLIHFKEGLEFDHVVVLDGGCRVGHGEDVDPPRVPDQRNTSPRSAPAAPGWPRPSASCVLSASCPCCSPGLVWVVGPRPRAGWPPLARTISCCVCCYGFGL